MKLGRMFCLLLVSLLALYPLGAVFAQEEYELYLLPSSGRYDTVAKEGESKDFDLDIVNMGTKDITNIAFSAVEPAGWNISFLPEKMDLLEAGESREIIAIMQIPQDIDAGDYMVNLKASGDQASAEKIDIRVKVNIIKEIIELNPTYPTLEAVAGEDFVYEVGFYYVGEDPREFNMIVTTPQDWDAYITPPYEKEKKISAVRLEPLQAAGNKIRLVVAAPFWPLPEPGEYKITLELVSPDGWEASTELKAVVTARYNLIMVPASERYNTKATAGEDNFFSIELGNLGTADVANIKFSSTKPEGWSIEFAPDKIDSLAAVDSQTVELNIKPPTETIAGDYSIAIRASGEQTASQEMSIRVTVETPTVWGWVGVVIIIIVVVGLVVVFMRFSRR